MGVSIFSQRLQSLMCAEKVSKRGLAEKTGVQRKSIINYVNGHFFPRYDSLCKIADFFEVSADYLLGRENECFCAYRSECAAEQISGVFVRRLNKLLEDKNMTRYRFAQKLDVGQSAISKWMHRVSMPETLLIMKIADAMDCTVDYLLGREAVKER